MGTRACGATVLIAEHTAEARPLVETMQANMTFLKTLSQEKNYGLIHHDFKGDNFIENDDKLFVIDFDSCCYNWYLCDLLMPIYYYFLYPRFNKENKATVEQLTEFVTNLVMGYQQQKIFPKEQVKYLLPLLKQLDILLYTTIKLLKRKIIIKGVSFDIKTTERILTNRIMNKNSEKDIVLETHLQSLLEKI